MAFFEEVVRVDVGELKPVEETALWLHPRDAQGSEVLFKALFHSVSLHPVIIDDHRKMSVQMPIDAVLGNQRLGDGAGAEVGPLFEHSKVSYDLLRAGYPSHACPRGEDLGE